jgi:hypothetical protein
MYFEMKLEHSQSMIPIPGCSQSNSIDWTGLTDSIGQIAPSRSHCHSTILNRALTQTNFQQACVGHVAIQTAMAIALRELFQT